MSEQTWDLADLVEGGDPDALLRAVDGLCAARSWDGLVELAQRCRQAVGRGRQLWGVAEHIDYRLALEAPGAWAGPAVVGSPARFTLGPLSEVAASTHSWAELGPYLPPSHATTITAYERVVRGEDLSAAPGLDPHVLEIPFRLVEWEPAYPVASYHADRADFPSPDLPAMAEVSPTPAPSLDHPVSVEALLALVEPWANESNGRVEALAVEGDALAALGALGVRRARLAEIGLDLAAALMAWAGASGGAYGRRRGAAAGRFATWWALAAVTGLLDQWPVAAGHLGEEAAGLRYFAWSDLVPPSGWTLHLAIEDPVGGTSWAVAAVDAR